MRRNVLFIMLLGLVCAQAHAAVEVVSMESALDLVKRIRAASPGNDVVAVDEVEVTLRNGTAIQVSAIWDGKNLVLRPKNGDQVSLPDGVTLFQRCSISVLTDDDDVAIASILGWSDGGASVTELTYSGNTVTERIEDGGTQLTDTYDTNADRNAGDMLAQKPAAQPDKPIITEQPQQPVEEDPVVAAIPEPDDSIYGGNQPVNDYQPTRGNLGGGGGGGGDYTDPDSLVGSNPPVEDTGSVSPTSP
jgi:hypothetical protein